MVTEDLGVGLTLLAVGYNVVHKMVKNLKMVVKNPKR
jgi:hypothetical protein